jgi:predicted transcriptional regulator
MKTAVSIPDDLFAKADAFARGLGRSRSHVHRDALAEYLVRHDPKTITSVLDELADELAAERDDWSAQAGRRALERSEW